MVAQSFGRELRARRSGIALLCCRSALLTVHG
jgi:hypothetical protein